MAQGNLLATLERQQGDDDMIYTSDALAWKSFGITLPPVKAMMRLITETLGTRPRSYCETAVTPVFIPRATSACVRLLACRYSMRVITRTIRETRTASSTQFRG